MSKNSDYVVYNDKNVITPVYLYNKMYDSQFLELLKLAVAFLISHLLYDFINVTMLNELKQYKFLCGLLMIIIIVICLYAGADLFTYLKIQNEKTDVIKQYTSQIANN